MRQNTRSSDERRLPDDTRPLPQEFVQDGKVREAYNRYMSELRPSEALISRTLHAMQAEEQRILQSGEMPANAVPQSRRKGSWRVLGYVAAALLVVLGLVVIWPLLLTSRKSARMEMAEKKVETQAELQEQKVASDTAAEPPALAAEAKAAPAVVPYAAKDAADAASGEAFKAEAAVEEMILEGTDSAAQSEAPEQEKAETAEMEAAEEVIPENVDAAVEELSDFNLSEELRQQSTTASFAPVADAYVAQLLALEPGYGGELEILFEERGLWADAAIREAMKEAFRTAYAAKLTPDAQQGERFIFLLSPSVTATDSGEERLSLPYSILDENQNALFAGQDELAFREGKWEPVR